MVDIRIKNTIKDNFITSLLFKPVILMHFLSRVISKNDEVVIFYDVPLATLNTFTETSISYFPQTAHGL